MTFETLKLALEERNTLERQLAEREAEITKLKEGP